MSKKIIWFVGGLLISVIGYSQAPQSFSYQAVIRDESGSLVQEEVISVQISIKQGSVDGTIIYAERHAALTNKNGLITLKIGEGSASTGDFQEIDWSNSPFYIETSVDLDGGTNYNIVTTSELLSVPFALYADKAQRSEKADYSDRALIADSVLNLPNNLVRQENQQLELRGDTLFLSDSNFVVVPGLGGIKPLKNPASVSLSGNIIQIYATSDGGYLAVDDLYPELGFYKLDQDLNVEWEKSYYRGGFFETPCAIIQTEDGGYLVASTNEIDGSFNYNIWIIKLNSEGSKIWDKSYGGSGYEEPSAVIQTEDGGYLVAGATSSNDGDISDGNNGNFDFWIVKLDSIGNKEWDKTYGGSETEGISAVIQTEDGGYLVAGTTNSNDGDLTNYNNNGENQIWVLNLDSIGNKEWNYLFIKYPKTLIKSLNSSGIMILNVRKDYPLYSLSVTEFSKNGEENKFSRTVSNLNPSLKDAEPLLNDHAIFWIITQPTIDPLKKSKHLIYKTDFYGNILWAGELPFAPNISFSYNKNFIEDPSGNLIGHGISEHPIGSDIFKFYPKGLGYQMN